MAPLALPGVGDVHQARIDARASWWPGAAGDWACAAWATLVNFISHTVIVGFTAGAGLLIIAAQLPQFLRRAACRRTPTSSRACTTFVANVANARPVDQRHRRRDARRRRSSPSRSFRRVPYMIVAMVVGSVIRVRRRPRGIRHRAHRRRASVAAAGALRCPRSIPNVWRQARADHAGIDGARADRGGLDRARRSRVKSGQRIDGNQEFIGQGLSNIAGAFTSAYAVVRIVQPQRRQLRGRRAARRSPRCSRRWRCSRSCCAVAPLAAYLPLAVMAALLFVVAWGLIDFAEIRRIARTSRGDLFVLAVTFVVDADDRSWSSRSSSACSRRCWSISTGRRIRVSRAVAPDPRTPQRRFAPQSDGVRAVSAARHPAPRRLAVLRRGRARPRRARGGAPRTARGEPGPAGRKRREFHRRRGLRIPACRPPATCATPAARCTCAT